LTVFTQYVVFFPVKGASSMSYLVVFGCLAAIPLVFVFRSSKIRGLSLGFAVLVGFLLLPYFAFCLGPIHLLALDDPPEAITVIEVRPTIESIVWTTNWGEEFRVFDGPVTLYLHPGEQRVYFGTMNIPAGSCADGVIHISNVVVDMEEDLSLGGPHSDSYEVRYQEMQRWFGNNATNWSRDDNIVRYTWSSGPKISTMELGGFSYPGIGGPDITLDFVMGDHDGKPESVTVIFEMPPGIPQPDFEVQV
jgi:hypothetical protein